MTPAQNAPTVPAMALALAVEAAERRRRQVEWLAKRLAAYGHSPARKDGRELECLQAFMSHKTRDDIFAALGIMTDIFAQAAAMKSGVTPSGAYKKQTERISASHSLAAISRLHDEAVRLYGMSFTNPNVKLFAAECCGSLFNAAEGATAPPNPLM